MVNVKIPCEAYTTEFGLMLLGRTGHRGWFIRCEGVAARYVVINVMRLDSPVPMLVVTEDHLYQPNRREDWRFKSRRRIEAPERHTALNVWEDDLSDCDVKAEFYP